LFLLLHKIRIVSVLVSELTDTIVEHRKGCHMVALHYANWQDTSITILMAAYYILGRNKLPHATSNKWERENFQYIKGVKLDGIH